ncbi:unnamed protein product [Rotaria socialis]|uniref:Uncharacterized protein n=1 Tax=Rotaria socialis TaxID=392032 RepID=A0A817TF52_9BILA|nr:unnamed protein product [Rotaria socialis]CAF3385290.1 unnamed protein product [Rotaria socialis]CAF3577877.1 unnamed protein product [Rotaria socialis]CAF3710751.1 unnamed protein product [Rotaria socialis]CAF4269402.1 unnamed protein product [Rotaria socialis]
MGACASKTNKNKQKYLKNDVIDTGNNNDNNNTNNNKKDSIIGQPQQGQSPAANVDKFANVPFIDSEEKLTTVTPPSATSPLLTEQTMPPNHDKDNDERTTVKTNFETNASYSNTETIEKLKQEVYTFLREKIFPINEEKQKLIDYINKRITGSLTESTAIDEQLKECFDDIEQHKHPNSDENNKIKNRLMNFITVYVASQSSDNSFLKALYDKLGSSLDLNSLNAETTEHETVNVTVTKTVRQVFVDASSTLTPNSNPNSTQNTPENVINLSNNEHNIPTDLPDDIRRKAEQVLNSFNDVIHAK